MTNKMSKSIGLLLAIMSVFTTCRALPDLHKQMTAQQLQTVFHVDSIHAVPQYEIIQLLHHNAANDGAPAQSTTHYRRRRRSIDVQQMSGNDDAATATTTTAQKDKHTHHVKKDLSKSPYYSELKHETAAGNENSLPSANRQLNQTQLSQIKVHNVTFSAFGEQVNLSLKPTKGLFKGAPHKLRMWAVNNEANATNGLNLEELLDEDHRSDENIGEVFQDEANMAAILMRRHLETGDLIMEGSIGHDMVIKPLPHELSPNKEQAHHVIYKRDVSTIDEHLSDFAFMEPDDLAASEKLERLQRRQKRSTALNANDDVEFMEAEDATADSGEQMSASSSATHARRKRQAPYIIYPEVLVIVDYDGYRLHGGDNLQVKRYFISFWNGVDLRYRLLKGPRIRISIAGIIISRGRDATPYLERNRVGRDAIDSAAALTDMGKYLFRERRLPVYDIAVAITKLDMCRRATAYGECNRGTAGFAYVGGACVVNKRLEKVNSVAIIEDTGGFSGIIVAAHEVGHLLGAVHDGSPPPSYLGGPGAQRCRWEDGYIMSDLRHTERGFRWSPCTVQSFHHFLNGDTATCLHNAPHEDSALGRSLPGTLLSLDAQCRRDRGTYACFKDERVCAQLFCFDAQTGYCVAYRPAAEGSTCGSGMHCLDGRCTPLPTNVVQDYGHQYRLAYKNGDESESATQADDNNDDSSEESDEDDNENEDDNDEQDNESDAQQEIANDDDEAYLQQNIRKADNLVEQTVVDTANTTTTTAATPDTNTQNTVKHTAPQQNTQKPPPNTFQFLAKILEDNNKHWLQLFNIPATVTNTHTPSHNTQQQLLANHSLSSEVTNNEIVTKLTTQHKQKHNKTATTTLTPLLLNTTLLSQQQQQQTQQQNLLNYYTNELRKQFQYYMQLINFNSYNTNTNTNLNSNNQNQNQNYNTVISTKPIDTMTMRTNTLNSNYSATTSRTKNGQPLENNNAADIDGDDVDADDDSEQANANDTQDDDVNNNEAFNKQKRKFNLLQQQHHQQQKQHAKTTQSQLMQQQAPASPSLPTISSTTISTTAKTTRSSSSSSSSGSNNNGSNSYVFGGRSTPRSSPSASPKHQYDAYYKKLQSLSAAATPTITTLTAPAVTPSATKKATLKNHQQQQQQFVGNFFKRTHYTSSSSNNEKLKINNNNNNNTPQSGIISSSSSSSSIHNHYNTNNNKHNHREQLESTTQQTQIVTNYIGDNTNNLQKIYINVAEPQQQQQQETTQTGRHTGEEQYVSYTTSTVTSSTSSASAAGSASATVTQKPKFKTQKLIRRQLRRTTTVK